MEVISSFTNCPRCSNAIDSRDGMALCRSCGWMPSTLETKQHVSAQKKMLTVLLSFGVFAIAAFIHVVNWDRFALEIIPLKAKQVLGASDNIDLNRIAEICSERFKYDCTEAALTDVAYQYNEVEAFTKLGLLQRKMQKWAASAKSYEMALSIVEKTKSEDQLAAADIYYGLAKAFEHMNNDNVASDYFERAIKAKPGVIQITVTEDYVKFLKAKGNLEAAKKVVEEARKRSGSKTLFAALEA